MSSWLSVLALLVSIVALVASWRLGARSARAAERSSAAAERSADDARRVATAEVNRDHEMYRPELGAAAFERVVNPRTKEQNLFLVFTLTRTYRVAGDTVHGAGTGSEAASPLNLGTIAQAGATQRPFIAVANGNAKLPQAVWLRFWPPVEGDPGERWSCPCGRQLDPSGKPHWEWRIPVPQG